jgi:flavin-dependent dehydrogenase
MSGCAWAYRSILAEVDMDVCVVGGGPAGAALALRLAQLGRSVAVVEKARFPRSHVGESLTGSVAPLLEVLGVLRDVEAAGFLSSTSATVLWAGEIRRRHTPAGWQVDRGLFDSILLGAARRAGVRIYQPANVVRQAWDLDHWSIRLDNGVELRSRYLAVAAGKRRLLGGRKTFLGPPTLGLFAYWRNVSSDETDTLVEAGPQQWYWGAPLPGGELNATVFVDPGLVRGRRPSEAYLELIRQSCLLRPRLNSACCGHVRVCDATPMLDESPVGAQWIVAGDAALAIDPLSSQGVQTAIGTALHAAVVLNTMIGRPGNSELAARFYRSRLKESAAFHAAAAGRFYQEHVEHCSIRADFWTRRATPISRPKLVCVNFNMPLKVNVDALFGPVAVVDDAYVVEIEGVTLRGKTYAFARDSVLVTTLLKAIDRPGSLLEIVRRWAEVLRPADAVAVAEWALHEGLLLQA